MPPEFGKPAAHTRSTPGAKTSNVKVLGDERPGLKKSTSELALEECAQLEEELAALKVAYEHFFLGNERLPPARAHEDFKKRMLRLKGSLVRNTAAKFRISSLHSKFLTYERLWQRTLQEIEAGTYKRDVLKARRRSQVAGSEQGERRKEAYELTEELGEDDLVEVAEVVPNEPQPVKPAARPTFLPQPVEPVPSSPPFRPVPSAPPAPGAPAVPSVAPVPAGTPFRGTPAARPVPAIPSVSPVLPAAATPAPGTARVAPGATPARGTPAAPAGATPSKGTPAIPPPGTPARGTPAFGKPGQGTSGIAAALESLADEPLTPAPSASSARAPAPSASRPASAAGGARPAAPAASRPASPASGSAALSDDKLRAVYDAYVSAKRRNHEDTSKMNYETVAANLRKQVPELLKQHNARSVEFKVVIKDGKAMLKAVPK